MWRGIILAVQFLTVLPLRMQVDWNERTGRIAVLSFPLVGAMIGALLVAQHALLFGHVSLLVLSFLLLFSSILKTKFGKKQPPPSLWNIISKGRY